MKPVTGVPWKATPSDLVAAASVRVVVMVCTGPIFLQDRTCYGAVTKPCGSGGSGHFYPIQDSSRTFFDLEGSLGVWNHFHRCKSGGDAPCPILLLPTCASPFRGVSIALWSEGFLCFILLLPYTKVTPSKTLAPLSPPQPLLSRDVK